VAVAVGAAGLAAAYEAVARLSRPDAGAWDDSLGDEEWANRLIAFGQTSLFAQPLSTENAAQASLLRCIFGPLPFRALTITPALLTWNDGLVVKMAQATYDDRHLPSGHLDPDRLSVLGDALEDAGCDDAELLGHLRGEGPHWRGCWAVDALLGRS
jgi:hypothetical protein